MCGTASKGILLHSASFCGVCRESRVPRGVNRAWRSPAGLRRSRSCHLCHTSSCQCHRTGRSGSGQGGRSGSPLANEPPPCPGTEERTTPAAPRDKTRRERERPRDATAGSPVHPREVAPEVACSVGSRYLDGVDHNRVTLQVTGGKPSSGGGGSALPCTKHPSLRCGDSSKSSHGCFPRTTRAWSGWPRELPHHGPGQRQREPPRALVHGSPGQARDHQHLTQLLHPGVPADPQPVLATTEFKSFPVPDRPLPAVAARALSGCFPQGWQKRTPQNCCSLSGLTC